MQINKKYYGQLTLVLGCMFGGKTSYLINKYRRYTIGGKKCLMIKYKNDTRYDNTKVVTHDNIQVDVDIANLTIKQIMGWPFDLTLGRQEILIGDGFLIGDGRNDPVAQWSYPLKSFDAARGKLSFEPFTLDIFAGYFDNDFEEWAGDTEAGDEIQNDQLANTSYTGGGEIYGVNLHYENKDSKKWGTWDFGTFFKNDNSTLHNDTIALSVKGVYDIPWISGLGIDGEIVQQLGHTNLRMGGYIDSTALDREALGGHLGAKYTFENKPFTPYISARYVYLPGDKAESLGKNEAFDPMFFNWADWGKWYLGNIVGGNDIINTNERVVVLEVGCIPNPSTQLRLQFFNTRLDEGLGDTDDWATKNYSNEINLIFDYWPNEIFYWGLELGYAHPLEAARAWYGNDQDIYEFMILAGVEF